MPIVSVRDLLSAKKHLTLLEWVNLVRKGNRMTLGHAGRAEVWPTVLAHVVTSRCGC